MGQSSLGQSLTPAARYFLKGQAVFYLVVALMIAIRPSGLTINHGLCYYELFKDTAPLYVIGLVSFGWLHFQAIRRIPVTDRLSRAVYTCFQGMGLCVIGMTFTPIMAGKWLGYIHVTFGCCLFLIQWGLGVRLFLGSQSAVAALLLAVQFVAAFVCILSLAHWLTYQTEGQIVFQLAFGAQMLRYLLHNAARL